MNQPSVDQEESVGIQRTVFLEILYDLLAFFFIGIGDVAPAVDRLHAVIDIQVLIGIIRTDIHKLLQRVIALHAHIIDQSIDERYRKIDEPVDDLLQFFLVFRIDDREFDQS